MSGEPAGLLCSGCQQLAYALLGGTQAICGNVECHVFTWNPTETLEENLAEMKTIDLSGWLW